MSIGDIKNYDKIDEAKGFDRLPDGGYIIKIKSVEDVESQEYLKCEFDILGGEFDGYFQKTFERLGFWAGTFVKSYKESARRFFKAFTNRVEESNPGYIFKPQEFVKLTGKIVGAILVDEVYQGQDGNEKHRIKVYDFKNRNDIETRNFEVPKDTKASVYAGKNEQKKTTKLEPLDDDGELPF
jgi:hypothetical protein